MIHELARKIPDVVRGMLLDGTKDPIVNAIDSPGDPSLQLLFSVYYEFLYPGASNKDISCWRCRGRVLRAFKEMHDELVKVEKEYQLIKSIAA